LFEQNIEKLLISERRKFKQKQGDQEKGSDPTSSNYQSHTSLSEDMAKNRNNEGRRIVNPPRRTLGDYVLPQGPRYFSSIVIYAATRSLELKPTFLSLISSHQFIGMDHEDPYTHLSTFYELV